MDKPQRSAERTAENAKLSAQGKEQKPERKTKKRKRVGDDRATEAPSPGMTQPEAEDSAARKKRKKEKGEKKRRKADKSTRGEAQEASTKLPVQAFDEKVAAKERKREKREKKQKGSAQSAAEQAQEASTEPPVRADGENVAEKKRDCSVSKADDIGSISIRDDKEAKKMRKAEKRRKRGAQSAAKHTQEASTEPPMRADGENVLEKKRDCSVSKADDTGSISIRDDKEAKKMRKAEKRRKRGAQSAAKHAQEASTEPPVRADGENVLEKKRDRSASKADEIGSISIRDDKEAKKQPKAGKKREHEQDTGFAASAATEEFPGSRGAEQPVKRGKKHKKANDQIPGDVKQDAAKLGLVAEPLPLTDVRERWHVQELDGGLKRQNKFMRLLGGKKAGETTGPMAAGGASRPTLDLRHVSSELERQFEAGRRMKYEANGSRKGLGA